MTALCPHCGQPLPETRLGVRLTPLKARIFDAVKRAGSDGIDRHDLFDIVFGSDASRRRSRHTLKAHIFQINEAIESTGYKIIGHSVARLVRTTTDSSIPELLRIWGMVLPYSTQVPQPWRRK